MSGPFLDPQLLRYTGTGNITDSLTSTAVDDEAMTTGGWMIWATQPFYLQINAESGSGMGAKPSAWPANYPVYVQLSSTKYLAIKRISTDGTFYANKIAGQV